MGERLIRGYRAKDHGQTRPQDRHTPIFPCGQAVSVTTVLSSNSSAYPGNKGECVRACVGRGEGRAHSRGGRVMTSFGYRIQQTD